MSSDTNTSEDSSGSSSKLTFQMRNASGTKWELEIPPKVGSAQTVQTVTVLDIKTLLTASSQPYVAGIGISSLKLIYKGRILDNDRALSDYGIVPGATLFVVKSSTSTSSSPASSSNAARTTTTPSSTTTAPAPSNVNPWGMPPSAPQQQAAPPNPWGMPPPGGMPGMGGAPPSMQQMQDALNNPMLQHLLNNNPDMMRQMMQQQMQNNPAVRQMMEANPQMAHLLNDPAAWNQAMEMMRNPAAMQQALRGQDLQLSQLENMPGGMAALSNMYSQYQEPLEQAMSSGGGGSSSATTANNNSSGSAGASGQAMPNPWGSPSTTNMSSSSSNANNANTAAPANPWGSMMGNMPPPPPGNNANPFGNMMMGMGGNMPPVTPEQQRQSMQAMLDNPAMSQMMQTALQQNPEFFRNMVMQQNPQLAQMFGNNPQAIDQMLQQMMQPETMRAMMQLQDQLQGMNLSQGGASGAAAPGAAPAAASGLDFANLLGGGNNAAGGMPPPFPPGPFAPWGAMPPGFQQQQPPQAQQSPAERFAPQLQSLYNMGFDDEQRNLQALQAAHGNLNRAVDQLLAGPPAPAPAAAPSDDSAQQQQQQQQPDEESNNNNNEPEAPPKSGTEKKND